MIPISKAIRQIVLYTLLISGSVTVGLWYFHHVKKMHATNDAFLITSIVQQTEEPEPLKTSYLAELLELSCDQPKNLYQINTQDAKRKLLCAPVIRDATVKRIRPSTVYVHYTMRKPIAFLGGYSNTAIDSDGYLIPFHPFFTPKHLPEIFLGCLPIADMAHLWGSCLNSQEAKLALELLALLSETTLEIRRLDLSTINSPSLGQREIVIGLDDKFDISINGKRSVIIMPRILRLEPLSYIDGLSRFKQLREHLIAEERVKYEKGELATPLPTILIDLRLPQLAFFRL